MAFEDGMWKFVGQSALELRERVSWIKRSWLPFGRMVFSLTEDNCDESKIQVRKVQ